MPSFKRLAIEEWQQFEKVNISFHDRVTILTGANGCGKTTLLNILARHAGWDQTLLATPRTEESTGIVKFFVRLFKGKDKSDQDTIGRLEYTTNQHSVLAVPKNSAATYALGIPNMLAVRCFMIPSHRPVFRYQQVTTIPITKKNKQNAFGEVSNSIRTRYHGGNDHASSFYMKNTLIGWMIQGYGVQRNGKAVMPSDAEQIRHVEGFEKALAKVLPKSLGFERLEVRNMEIVFICNGGKDEFVLETCSGGISALIDMTWQIFMFSTGDDDRFTVIIDEVENHLHPTLQRRLLPDLTAAFPNARFIVSTHSPLMVNSVKDSYIYALRYNDEKKVESIQLDFASKPKTAAEILDEVLGVSFTMPAWVEDDLNKVLTKYLSLPATADIFTNLRYDLAAVGLERLLPEAMTTVLESSHD